MTQPQWNAYMKNLFKKVLVTGGAGYVGSQLVPALLDNGYQVCVLDLYLYGKDIFSSHHKHESLQEIQGDIRDQNTLRFAMQGCDAVIHLACISNDPSFDLDPTLGKSINYDAFQPLVRIAKESGVKRFIYASSSSVYGIKSEQNVTEELLLNPLTDYSKYKAECEKILLLETNDQFETIILRPATVCGYAPRLRLDLTVNILTTHAYCNNKIKVFGGSQLRPNIHISDMVNAYLCCLSTKEIKNGSTYNVGYQNYPVSEIAEMVKYAFNSNIEIKVVKTDDNRSYHISSEKIQYELGFSPKHSINDAINQLKQAFDNKWISDALNNPIYYNIKQMQQLQLS